MTYQRPQHTIEQQFIDTTSNAVTPTLYPCMVGPVYDIIENEQKDPYAGIEIGYTYDSAYPVDTRITDDYEVIYPIKVKFSGAQITKKSAQAGSTTGATITASGSGVFPTGENTGLYVRFNAGSYQHVFPSDQGTLSISSLGGDSYKITSTLPIFYQNDYDSSITSELDYIDGANSVKTGKTITGVDSNGYWIQFIDSSSPSSDPPKSVTKVDRASLLSSERTLRRIRSVSSGTTATLYTALAYANYTISSFDVILDTTFTYDAETLITLGCTISSDEVRLPFNMTTVEGEPIEYANIYLSYRALRSDKFETLTGYSTQKELSEYTVNKYNTAVWMTKLALEHSNGRTVLLAPLGEKYFIDPVGAYQDALDFILEQEEPYGIVVGTMHPSVVSALKSHVDTASNETNTRFRRGYVTHKLETENVILKDQTTLDGYVESEKEGFTGNALLDANSTFIDSGVLSGHYVRIKSWVSIEPKLKGTFTGTASGTIDINSANTRVVLTGLSSDPGIKIGQTVKFAVSGGHNTANDTGKYTDYTRDGAYISTGQTYGALGYRVISSMYQSGTLTMYIYTIGATEPDIADSASVQVTFYDGPLSLTDELKVRECIIGTVDSNNRLSVSFKPGWTGKYTGLTYDIVKKYTKDEQAQKYAEYASSIADRRMSILYPDCYQDADGITLPGYFICAARAGWRAGRIPQEPMTNAFLTGFYKLLRTDRDKYFRDSHFDKMASGGVEIYLQTNEGSNIRCRHQLTTDMESINKQEESATCCVDTACKLLKAAIRPLIGRYNIGQDLFSVIHTRIAGVRTLVVDRPMAKFGSILKSFEIKTLAQDPANSDGLILEIETETQKPFNRMHTIMRIR